MHIQHSRPDHTAHEELLSQQQQLSCAPHILVHSASRFLGSKFRYFFLEHCMYSGQVVALKVYHQA